MRIGSLGKKRYAFGLNWVEAQDAKPHELVRDALEGGAGVYAVVTNSEKQSVVGYAPLVEAFKGRVISYAAALAALGQDGVYIAPVEDEVWYVAISDGLVVPGTDQTLPAPEAMTAIGNMKALFGLPLIVVDGVELPFAADRTFDAERAVANIKSGVLRRIGGGNANLGKVIFLVVAASALAFGGWYKFLRKADVMHDDGAAMAAQVKGAYLTEMRRHVQALPIDPSWASRAHALSMASFPSVIAGWRQEGVMCQPTQCVATYALMGTAPFAVSPLHDRFGADAVALLGDRRSLTVTMGLPPTEMAEWPDDVLLAPPGAAVPVLDAAGLVPLHFDGAIIDGAIATVNVSASITAPPGASVLYSDKLAVRQGAALDGVRLRLLSAYFANAGFAPTSIAFSGGVGATPAGWRIELFRLHGGEG